MVVLGGGVVSYERGIPVAPRRRKRTKNENDQISFFSGPLYVLELAGIQWRVVQTKTIEKGDLMPLC